MQRCKTCTQAIYWIEDLGAWYHWSAIDMLTCRSTVVEPMDGEWFTRPDSGTIQFVEA